MSLNQMHKIPLCSAFLALYCAAELIYITEKSRNKNKHFVIFLNLELNGFEYQTELILAWLCMPTYSKILA